MNRLTRARMMSYAVISIALAASAGCGSSSTPSGTSSTGNPSLASGIDSKKESGNHNSTDAAASPLKRRKIAPVEIDPSNTSRQTKILSNAEQLEAIRQALKPLQILLGQWNGLSHQAKTTDKPEWAYDWVSKPTQPGLRMISESNEFVRNGRLTYLPEIDQFEFQLTNAEGVQKTLRGTFTEQVMDLAGDDQKLQRKYKLQLTEPEADEAGEQLRITFNQQENNRYILEIDRKRGNGQFGRVETIHTQRQGTSFAISDTDYGDKTCIISQGLGTISVSYKGKSFWVCCSGCKAAFEEDPEKWIAKWEKMPRPKK